MNKRKVAAIISAITLVTVLVIIFGINGSWGGMLKPGANGEKPGENQNQQPDVPDVTQPEAPKPEEPKPEEPKPEEPKKPEHKEVRGVYMTGYSVGLEGRLNKFIELANITELNAFVIDVKDDRGEISYESTVPMVKELGADSIKKIKDIKKVLQTLEENDIYPIARIVTFKDNNAATKHPEIAIKSKDGSVWRDYKKVAWLNPYIKESWEYAISVAEEAAELGFKEIQFDYVRFPTDGNRKIIDYGPAAEGSSMDKAISGFLSYARERLSKKGVVVSADIYGLVTTVSDDMGIGQQLESLTTAVDVMCPMVYPSHYAYGSYGIKYPDLEPYNTVYKSLSTAKERVDNLETDLPKAKIRPWLQDFTGAWLRPKSAYKVYKAEDVRAQIQAAYDSGLTEWILWDSNNTYTEGALEKQ